MDFIYPFQPPALLHDTISKELLDDTNKMCDELLPDKEALEAGFSSLSCHLQEI